MTRLITEWSTLPNLHPAVVHFPLAWLPLAMMVEAIALALKRHRRTLTPWAVGAWVAAGLATGAAYWAGRDAAAGMTGLAPDLQAAINTHADWAWRTLWAVGIVAAARLVTHLLPAARDRAWSGALFLLLSLGCIGLLLKTADLGGGLVYQHGIAVAPAEQARQEARRSSAPAADRADAAPEERFERRQDGFSWRPEPSDAAALGAVLTAAPGTDLMAVRTATPGPDVPGLPLLVDGEALLLFPGDFGDGLLSAQVVTASFTGSLGLLHHFQDASEYEELAVELPGGELTLSRRDGADTTIYDSAATKLPVDELQLVVSAIGRHLRGTVAGELIVHGHRPAVSGGRVGLRLDGHGAVRILAIEAQAASDSSH